MLFLEYKPDPLALIWHRSDIRGDNTRDLARQGAAMLRLERWSAWRLVHTRTGETIAV